MPWTDLFKSKSRGVAADPRIRWFGKLPTYADYYSSSNDEDWVVEFNTWIMKGYELYHTRGTRSQTATRDGRSGAQAPRRLPIGSCIIRLPGSGMTVFGTVQDYGGDMRGRPFPMCFYVGVPTSQWPGPTSDQVAAAGNVVADLLSLRDRVIRFCNAPGPLESVFGDRQVDLGGMDAEGWDASWLDRARQVPLADWFAGAGHAIKARDPDEWLGLLAEWGKSITRQDSAAFEPTLRFPLAGGVPVDVQAAGWVRWLESHMDLKRRLMSLVVSGQPAGGVRSLTLIVREVVSDDFLLLTPLWAGLPYVDDAAGLGGGPPAGEGGQASGPQGRLAESDATWADLVEGRLP